MSALMQRVSNTKMTVSIVIGLIVSSFGLPGLSSSIAPDFLALIILYWAMLGGDDGPRLSTGVYVGYRRRFFRRPNSWCPCLKIPVSRSQ
jgi:hypothetical protein